jgi:hypothetical protein
MLAGKKLAPVATDSVAPARFIAASGAHRHFAVHDECHGALAATFFVSK